MPGFLFFDGLRALRAEIDKGIRSLDAGQGRESSIDDFLRQRVGWVSATRIGAWRRPGAGSGA